MLLRDPMSISLSTAHSSKYFLSVRSGVSFFKMSLGVSHSFQAVFVSVNKLVSLYCVTFHLLILHDQHIKTLL